MRLLPRSMEITSKNMAVLQKLRESEAVKKATLQADGARDGKKRVEGRIVQHKSSCVRCGGFHSAKTCRFKELFLLQTKRSRRR